MREVFIIKFLKHIKDFMVKERADIVLVKLGLIDSREKAKSLILAG